MWLAIFTAGVGMFIAPGKINLFLGLVSIVCIALGAGAAGALNMWWDKDIDSLMDRTSSRPVAAGNIHSDDAFVYGISLSIFSVMFLGLASNWLAALLLAFTIFFYVVIYSILLKTRTPQNIVIGGAAGAIPPVVGWIVVTESFAVEPFLLFLLIFFWTPPHFWSLSVIMKDEYKKADIPMFPVVYGIRETRKKILEYTVLVLVVSQLIALSSVGGLFFFVTSNMLNVFLLFFCIKVYMKTSESAWNEERKFFKFTILYLFLYFGALTIQSLVNKYEAIYIVWPQLF
jgi:protoheme IX farnesyltransferase